ncbi:MAG TPA: hypothetical protein VFA59_10000 [Vicinamibacterales bacterium]|nr:hypothetical protein [Vicinamibacterales bacterium]
MRRPPSRSQERRRTPRDLPPGSVAAQLRYLLARVETLEQLCYAQVRRITALQAQIDHMDAKRRS